MDILTQFKNNLVKFFDELIEMFPQESQFVVFRVIIRDQIPITVVMDHFVTSVLPMRDNIKKRDDRIFTESNVLNFGMDKDSANIFPRIWTTLSKDDRAAIWQWMDAFVFLADKYVKSQ